MLKQSSKNICYYWLISKTKKKKLAIGVCKQKSKTWKTKGKANAKKKRTKAFIVRLLTKTKNFFFSNVAFYFLPGVVFCKYAVFGFVI